MITQCPSCSTLFRVTPEQLQAHQGTVRCGHCMAVFDGSKSLVVPPEPAQERAASGAAEGAGFRLEPVGPAQAAVAAQPPAASAATTEYRDQDYGPAPEQLLLDVQQQYSAEQRGGAGGWAVSAVLLGFVLAGQAAHWYRSELAALYPALKPHMVRLCGALRCEIPPPQRPKQITIEASDLQVADPARPGVIQLTATLRNHAGYDLGYPALDLVLTNSKEHALARRIFAPKEYLERGKDVAKGIAASAEITIRLDLDTGDLNPAGFRLDLLPAP